MSELDDKLAKAKQQEAEFQATASTIDRPPPEPEKDERKRPKYPSEKRRTKATFDLPAAVIQAIKDISAEEARGAAHPSKVAAAFLEYALNAYEDGRLQLIFEHDGPGWRFVAEEVGADPGTESA